MSNRSVARVYLHSLAVLSCQVRIDTSAALLFSMLFLEMELTRSFGLE